MRYALLAATILLAPQCWGADVIGGGLTVYGVRPVDESRVAITVQGGSSSETFMVDCIGATWGFEGGATRSVAQDQRSQAIAYRACRDVVFKAEAVKSPGSWSAPALAQPAPRPAPPPTPSAAERSVFSTYTRESYPKTFAVWGDDGVQYLRFMERLAVEHVSAARACDRVDYVGLSESKSRPPRDAVVFVDCSNRNRFYIGAAELKISPNDLKHEKTY